MNKYSLHLDPQDVKIIDLAAEKLGVKRNWFIRAAVNSFAKKVMESNKFQAVNILETGTRKVNYIKEI